MKSLKKKKAGIYHYKFPKGNYLHPKCFAVFIFFNVKVFSNFSHDFFFDHQLLIFRKVLFNFLMAVNFSNFLCFFNSNFIPLWSENILCCDFSPLKCDEVVLQPNIISILEIFLCTFEKIILCFHLAQCSKDASSV